VNEPDDVAHLVHGAEDVGVVLLEAADADEARQGSRQLVPVQDAEVGHANGQLSPGARPVIEHQTANTNGHCGIFFFKLTQTPRYDNRSVLI